MTPRNFNLSCVFILSIIFICSWDDLNGMDPLTKGDETYALIIGVSDYSDESIEDLEYSDDDTIAFYEYHTGPAGGRVTSNNIRLLLQEKATVASVYNSIKYFKDKLVKGDKFPSTLNFPFVLDAEPFMVFYF